MIKLIHNGEKIIKPTMFPDGTSQVWKLDLKGGTPAEIIWYFESEGEIIHLAQLVGLLQSSGIKIEEIYIPFLPYARQDKPVQNDQTFAFNPFVRMLEGITGRIPVKSLDVHGHSYYIKNVEPTNHILTAIIQSKADLICYPDSGAQLRYSRTVDFKSIHCEKIRNQATGEITGLKIWKKPRQEEHKLKGTVLIVDDICDGGKTFIETAKVLYKAGASKVDLYVTHGIFSKGRQVLHDAGIKNIYTTKSLLNNTTGYSIEKHTWTQLNQG